MISGVPEYFWSSGAKPVAITNTLMSSPSESSTPIPKIISAIFPASFWIWSLMIPISSMVTSWSPLLIRRSTFFAPVILLSFKSGESRAFFTASCALFSPEAIPSDISAVPLFCKTDLASRKSIFTMK